MKNSIFLKQLNKKDDAIFYDMVLFDCRYPVLFTCVDAKKNLYLCACYKVDSKSKEWIMACTTEVTVISLLQNKITIHDAFSQNSDFLYRIILKQGDANPTIEKLRIQDVPENILPTSGYFMDADEDEFNNEIAELENRRFEKLYESMQKLQGSLKRKKKIAVPQTYQVISEHRDSQYISSALKMTGVYHGKKRFSIQRSETHQVGVCR